MRYTIRPVVINSSSNGKSIWEVENERGMRIALVQGANKVYTAYAAQGLPGEQPRSALGVSPTDAVNTLFETVEYES